MRAPVCAALACIVLVACEHSEPFQVGKYGPTGPRTGGNPVQVTYNPGQDLLPAWLPDGSAFVYTGERLDRADRDRCLAFMPGGGGGIARYACRTTAPDDSINVFDEAVPSADGQLAYVRSSNTLAVSRLGPDAEQLVVASVADPTTARVLQVIPFTASWGMTFDGISHVAWLSPSRIAAVGERITHPQPCRSCAADTVRTGIAIMIVDFAGATPVLTRLADGDSASSLAAAANGDTLYFTRDGDSRVYRHTFASGVTDTLYDFVFGIARDVSVANGRLAAIVGGAVSYGIDSVLGGSQPDHGGPLFVLSPSHPPTQIGDTGWLFRRPALSPDGMHLVVSAWSTAATANLWLFQLP